MKPALSLKSEMLTTVTWTSPANAPAGAGLRENLSSTYGNVSVTYQPTHSIPINNIYRLGRRQPTGEEEEEEEEAAAAAAGDRHGDGKISAAQERFSLSAQQRRGGEEEEERV